MNSSCWFWNTIVSKTYNWLKFFFPPFFSAAFVLSHLPLLGEGEKKKKTENKLCVRSRFQRVTHQNICCYLLWKVPFWDCMARAAICSGLRFGTPGYSANLSPGTAVCRGKGWQGRCWLWRKGTFTAGAATLARLSGDHWDEKRFLVAKVAPEHLLRFTDMLGVKTEEDQDRSVLFISSI